MKFIHKLATTAALLSLVPSCYQMQTFDTETIPTAKVELGQDNYRVLATRVSGEDSGFTILPIIGTAANILSLGILRGFIPAGINVTSPSEHDALQQVYTKTGANQAGRSTQLINVRKEIGGYNALIFGRPKIRVTADLIEFTR